MDFHSLTRKQLQALCKKNKIPANITNVAMADSLNALEIVEGLNEILNQSESHSPEKSVPESPQIPRTATRSTRRTTTITEEDIPITPAVPTTRRRAPVASSRRKEEGSVQTVYSTRRSVRLLEKTMAELSLKTEPMKMHVLDEVEETKKDHMSTGSDLQTMSDEVSEKPDDSEICSLQNPNVSLENRGEVKDDVLEILKSDDCEAKDEAYDESDVLLGKKFEKAIEMNDAVIDGMVTEAEKDLNAIEGTGSEDFSAEVLDDVFAAESSLKQEIDNLVSVEESVETNPLSLSSFGDQAENPENECQQLEDKQETNMDVAEEDDHHVNDDPELLFSTEEESDGNDEVSDENSSEEESDSDTESLVDVDVIEVEDFAMTPKSARQMGPFCPLVSASEVAANIPLPKIQELGNSENLFDIYVHPPSLDKTPTSVKQQMSPYRPLLSGGKDTGGVPLSPLAAESLAGQFPRPTQSTPMKSSSKKQTTIQKLAQVSDINKENIDNGGGKVEPKKDKVKKNKNVDILDGKSLRKLTKMLKEKLQITNNSMNNEDKNVTKEPVGKTRPALQTLPENRMAANGEEEN